MGARVPIRNPIRRPINGALRFQHSTSTSKTVTAGGQRCIFTDHATTSILVRRGAGIAAFEARSRRHMLGEGSGELYNTCAFAANLRPIGACWSTSGSVMQGWQRADEWSTTQPLGADLLCDTCVARHGGASLCFRRARWVGLPRSGGMTMHATAYSGTCARATSTRVAYLLE